MLDNIAMALQSLRSNKMRALLTMLGIIIGIGAVIAIETVGNSLSSSISDSMSSFGASDITISLTQKESEDSGAGGVSLRMFQTDTQEEEDRITDEMIAEYRAAFPDQIAYIELSETVGTAAVDAGGEEASVSVVGINDEYAEGEELELLYGRSIRNDTDSGRRLCLVADEFVTEYMDVTPMNAIGQSLSVQVNNRSFTFYIVGVYRLEDSSESEADSDSESEEAAAAGSSVTSFYIPLDVAKELSGSLEGYSSLTVITSTGTDTTAFVTTSENFFASYYTQNDVWTVTASSMENLVSTMTEMLDIVSLAISAIAAISLLVGGIGVMNIMLVSVTERTREIGTRKALGAPGQTIRMQFIIEAVVICLIGGAIGILTGVGLGAVVCHIMGYSARADMEVIVLVVGISMAIGIFFGYYPANKASKLDPIEALRYE